MRAREDSNVPTSRRLSVTDFRTMTEAGIFDENDRVELIDGQLIDMAPIGPKHADIVNLVARTLDQRRLGEHLLLTVQNPVQLDRHTEVYPDAAVVRHRRYSEAHPKPKDVLLIIEVSDRTAAYDREVKLPAYAACGIPEAWIVDVAERCVERYREPWTQQRIYASGERIQRGTVAMLGHPQVQLLLADLFPSPET